MAIGRPKDEKDDLDAEIEYKLRRGYPQDNIIFEDSVQAVLIQNRREVMRCPVDDVDRLQRLLELFFGYERPEIAEFRKAVEQFKTDLPEVLKALRGMIEGAYAENAGFRTAANAFLKQAQESINPGLTAADVREILIQHILTEEIFALVFPGTSYHEDNNVARELYKLEGTFFTGNTKHQTLRALEPYYAAIRRSAGQISSHHEKQTFLKVVYENFYKVYNPKAADRLGVVYTPNEIVRFMIESADWLCEQHFGRNLIDRDVEILDPAAGTGTFICEMLEHFRGQPAKLKHKYLEELHANEVAILPYYVANLNIEATYAAISGEYLEYPNLCFVDTLDNVAGLRRYSGQQVADLFGMGEENIERIKRQNRRKISVVIGNPPYNANQANENDNNKNREYPDIDARIKDTYIKASTAQKTKLYDMYARFFRWASDRIAENGVVAFISNRSYVDSRTFDGFRDVVTKEFNEIHIVDLGGDVRANPKLSGTKHNVFGIQTGVAIGFLVKRKSLSPSGRGARGESVCRIFYSRRPEMETAEEKLGWLSKARLSEIERSEIRPDAKHNWLNLTDNDFDTLIPVASKAAKAAKKPSQEKAIFKLFSLGVASNRDEWVYADSKEALEEKVQFFCNVYQAEAERWAHSDKKLSISDFVDRSIKWTAELEAHLKRGTKLQFDTSDIVPSLYRPFVKKWMYFAPVITHRAYQNFAIFPPRSTNVAICFTTGGRLDFFAFSTNAIPSLTVLSLDANQCLPFWRYDDSGNRIDNITDWALKQFRDHYKAEPSPQPSPGGRGGQEASGKGSKKLEITKEAIFHYVYAVLHDPVYREKYALNLKREFPRIPFYPDFWRWADWGRELVELHISYESVEPFPLERTDLPMDRGVPVRQGRSKALLAEVDGPSAKAAADAPKALLRADKQGGRILLDAQTTLSGVLAQAWDYKLGNRSALEWILDQYKEKKPKDPTIREKFNTYRFADYKEKVIDLLQRVTSVSVRTVAIVSAMKQVPR
ncbi:MAG: type ISP restriction/modification enzyme [Gammaproteobacteria bacterium]